MSCTPDAALRDLQRAGARVRATERLLQHARHTAGDTEVQVIAGVLRDVFVDHPELRLLQIWERYDAPIGMRIAAPHPTAEAIRRDLTHLSSFGIARFAAAAGSDMHHRTWIVASRAGVQIGGLPGGGGPPADLRHPPHGHVPPSGTGLRRHLARLRQVREQVAEASGRWESAQATWSAQTRVHHDAALAAFRDRYPWAVALKIFPDGWMALVGAGSCRDDQLTPGFHPLSGDGWTAEIDGVELVDVVDVSTLRAMHREPLIAL